MYWQTYLYFIVVVLLYPRFIFFSFVSQLNHLGQVCFSCGASDFYTRNIICWPSSHQKSNKNKYTVIESLELLVWAVSWNSNVFFFKSCIYHHTPKKPWTKNKWCTNPINLRMSVFQLWIAAMSLIFLEHPHQGCSLNNIC